MLEEIAPTLRANPEMDKSLCDRIPSYARSVLERFENVAVKDQLDRIAMDGSEKFRVQGSPRHSRGDRSGTPHGRLRAVRRGVGALRQARGGGWLEVKDMGARRGRRPPIPPPEAALPPRGVFGHGRHLRRFGDGPDLATERDADVRHHQRARHGVRAGRRPRHGVRVPRLHSQRSATGQPDSRQEVQQLAGTARPRSTPRGSRRRRPSCTPRRR